MHRRNAGSADGAVHRVPGPGLDIVHLLPVAAGSCSILSPGPSGRGAAYIDSWLKRLRDDKKLIVIAAAQAQKAADLILGRTSGERN